MPPPEIPQKKPKIPWLPVTNVRLPGLDFATILLVLIVSVHWAVERAGGPNYVFDLYKQLGLTWTDFKSGKVWQVFTYGLLHGNWLHLTVNVLMFWLVGGRVIHILGHQAWFKVVFFGILVGGGLHLITAYFLIENGAHETRLVGISGACYALLLTLTTLSPESKMWPIPISGKNLGLGIILCELLLWLMSPKLSIPVFSKVGEQFVVLGGGELFQISHACHFGGGIAGWWIARKLLAPLPSLKDLQQMRAEREGTLEVDDAG